MFASHRLAVAFGVLPLFATVSVRAEVEFPSGIQDYESMTLGASVATITDWVFVNASGANFTVVAANDVLTNVIPRGSSMQWLRITDVDDVEPLDNRFYSPNVVADPYTTYRWTYYANLENTPPSTGSKPRFTVQHLGNTGFANAWGIEFTSTGANLIVTGIGGTAASTPLYSLASPTGIGDWVKLVLQVRFDNNTVSASVNDAPSVSLPINLVGTANKNIFRFCYRGEGAGNKVTMLLDDVSVVVIPPIPAVSEWGLVVMGLLVVTAGLVTLHRCRRPLRA